MMGSAWRSAILDRLMHRCAMLEFEGKSYRLKEIAPRIAITPGKPEVAQGKVQDFPGNRSRTRCGWLICARLWPMCAAKRCVKGLLKRVQFGRIKGLPECQNCS